MTFVFVREGEDINSALKRFGKKVQDARILLEVKERQAYVKPSDQRRRDAAAGKSRAAKKKRKMDKILEFLTNNKVPYKKSFRPRPQQDGQQPQQGQSTRPPYQNKPYTKKFDEEKTKRTLYVGGLAYGTVEQSLFNHFNSSAPVESVKIIYDRETKKSRGFGFVELKSETDVETVIASLNETHFEGRRILVSANRTKKPDNQPQQPQKPVTQPKPTEEDLELLQQKFNVSRTGS